MCIHIHSCSFIWVNQRSCEADGVYSLMQAQEGAKVHIIHRLHWPKKSLLQCNNSNTNCIVNFKNSRPRLLFPMHFIEWKQFIRHHRLWGDVSVKNVHCSNDLGCNEKLQGFYALSLFLMMFPEFKIFSLQTFTPIPPHLTPPHATPRAFYVLLSSSSVRNVAVGCTQPGRCMGIGYGMGTD